MYSGFFPKFHVMNIVSYNTNCYDFMQYFIRGGGGGEFNKCAQCCILLSTNFVLILDKMGLIMYIQIFTGTYFRKFLRISQIKRKFLPLHLGGGLFYFYTNQLLPHKGHFLYSCDTTTADTLHLNGSTKRPF